jgi:signal transduction histidine kinase
MNKILILKQTMKELKILMLEDVEEDAGLLDRVLSKEKIKFTRLRVTSREDFIKALNDFAPDVILSDHALPQFNSVEALKITQEQKIDAPFIIVTGTVSEEFAVNCLKKGADDYILKTNLSRLPSAISHSLREHQSTRVQKVQEEALEKQNTDLIKINKELDSFVYNISHTLRAPLVSVLGLVSIAKLDHNKNDDDVQHYFNLMAKSVQRLDHTLREILEYGQNLRTGLDLSQVDLKKLVNESLDGVKNLIGSFVVETQFDVNCEVPFFSDSYRLSVILTYLLSNSIKFKDDKKDNQLIRISVSISSDDAATINVFDNGVGIRPNYLSNITKMFFRANDKSDGAGLGLHVVDEVIQKLKGTLLITSKYGEWTNVRITLPSLKG